MAHHSPSRLERAVLNLEVWGAAVPVIAELNRREIPVLVLKSLPQVEDLYGDAAGRPSGDVDLVVPWQHTAEVMELLWADGWTLEQRLLYELHPDAPPWQRPWHFMRGELVIDLHSDRMAPWYKPGLDAHIWQRAVPASRDGVSFLVPAPEDRLLILAAQIAVEGFPPAKLPDLVSILQAGETFDWPYLTERAVQAGLSLYLRLSAEMAAARSSAPLAPLWRRVPLRPRLRYALLWRAVCGSREELDQRRQTLLALLGHDRLRRVLPLWRETLLPDRLTLAAHHLGYWPTRRQYLAALLSLYLHRLRDRS